MKKLIIILLAFSSIATFAVYETYFNENNVYDINDYEKDSSIKLKAGETIQFRFHNSYDDSIRICELKIPKNYSKDKPTPIFVWFSPGKGSYNVKNIPPFVNFDDYFLVALPYKNNQLPRLVIQNGNIDDLWDYDKLMFDYVKDIIPNLSKKIRIAAGFSSGAHFVASGLDRNWIGFTDFFNTYIIHEGGSAPEMTYKGIKPTDKVLFTYGENSVMSGKLVGEMLTQYHKNVAIHPLPGTAHEINTQTIEYIRTWINSSFPEEGI